MTLRDEGLQALRDGALTLMPVTHSQLPCKGSALRLLQLLWDQTLHHAVVDVLTGRVRNPPLGKGCAELLLAGAVCLCEAAEEALQGEFQH